MRTRHAVLLLLPAALGCAHRPLSGADLDRVFQPAFVARIDEGAGPRSRVFQQDSAYSEKLKKLEPKEADRRLQVKLGKGMSRFEVSETLRAKLLAGLPQQAPWTNLVDPAAVARELQSFLVEEVPANPPDYDLLRPLGTDAVVELVIEDYGMRSSGGHAGSFIEGYGRMFLIDGRKELWRRSFRADQLDSGSPHVDPFRVGKDPNVFRTELSTLIEGVAALFARDLSPAERKGSPPPPPLRQAPAAPRSDELPAPDPI